MPEQVTHPEAAPPEPGAPRLIEAGRAFRPDPLFPLVRALPWNLAMLALGAAGAAVLGVLPATIGPFTIDRAWGWWGVLVPVALLLGRVGWDTVDWACRAHRAEAGRVTAAIGVLARVDARIASTRIQASWVIAPLRERLVGLGSVAFASAGGGRPEVIWRGMRRPQRVLAEALEIIRRHEPDPEGIGEIPAEGDPRVDGAGSGPVSPASPGGPGRASAPLVIGIAGGIGSGKSAVARAFAELGCVVSDSDAQARAALDRSEVRDQLADWWGAGVLDAEGRIDRRAVGEIVFADAAERSRLESLVHPLVRRSRRELVEQARAAGAPAVIVDAPLLFEVGLDAECDAVVFVDADRATRLERVRARNGWDHAELDRRENAQMPLDEKRRRSDYSVSNTGDRDGLNRRVARILGQLLSPPAIPIDRVSTDGR